MKKEISHAFGKDVYLLGKDLLGELLWLEAPSWDCGWYWSAGYVEVYTNQLDPSRATDITSHSHFDTLLGWSGTEPYHYHINEILIASTLSDKEPWRFSDLMKSIYSLKEAAEVLHRGGSHLTSPETDLLRKPKLSKELNALIPLVWAEAASLLSPVVGEGEKK